MGARTLCARPSRRDYAHLQPRSPGFRPRGVKEDATIVFNIPLSIAFRMFAAPSRYALLAREIISMFLAARSFMAASTSGLRTSSLMAATNLSSRRFLAMSTLFSQERREALRQP